MRFLAPILLIISAAAFAQNDEEYNADLIHSDLPLWGSEDEGVWPRHFTDTDGSFGCAWQVKLGDWKIAQHDGEEDWIRLSNYGVFHCFTMVSAKASKHEDLEGVQTKPSYFIELGTHKINGKQVTLWAVQMGGRPGSDYMLLSGESGPHPIAAFELLQVKCPKRNTRKGPSLDTLATEYCAVNSKQELILLAKSMAKISSFGKMTFESESPDSDK